MQAQYDWMEADLKVGEAVWKGDLWRGSRHWKVRKEAA